MKLKSMLLAIAATTAVVAQTSHIGQAPEVEGDPISGCPAERIDTLAASPDEVATICRGARVAFDALERCGLRLPHPIKVEAGSALAMDGGLRRWGDFTPSVRRVRLASRAQREEAPPLFFGTSLSRSEHYAGVAAHEIAHAIFAHAVVSQGALSLELRATAHEYIAYVVQMMSFSETTRQRILARDPPPPVSNLFVFSFFLLYADPDRFAVNAYAHFVRPENGCAFIGRVLRGEVHFPPASD